MDLSVDEVRDLQIQRYLELMALTVLFYDHIITLGPEISRIWKHIRSAGSAWFLLNRYFAFIVNIIVGASSLFSIPKSSCQSWISFHQMTIVVSQVIAGIILTVRTYALYGRSRRVLGGMAAVAIILIAISCWALFTQDKSTTSQTSACISGLTQSSAIRLAAAWEALLVYDLLVIILTILGTRRTWETRFSGRLTILSVFLRDGATYFCVMALANLSNILTFYFAAPILKGVLSQFASSISVTMISRVMLNLHEAAMPVSSSSGPTATTTEGVISDSLLTSYIEAPGFADEARTVEVPEYDQEGEDLRVEMGIDDIELVVRQMESPKPLRDR